MVEILVDNDIKFFKTTNGGSSPYVMGVLIGYIRKVANLESREEDDMAKSKAIVVGARGELGGEFVKQLRAVDIETLEIARENWAILGNASTPFLDLWEGSEVIIAVGKNSDTGAENLASNFEAVKVAVDFANRIKASNIILLSTGGLTIATQDEIQSSTYYSSKALGESMLSSVAKVPYSIYRLFFPIGPQQKEDRFVPKIFNKLRNSEEIWSRSDGGPFLTLTNRFEAVKYIIESQSSEFDDSQPVINVSSGLIYSIKEISINLANLAGFKHPRFIINENLRNWDYPKSKNFDWTPVDFDVIVRELLNTYDR